MSKTMPCLATLRASRITWMGCDNIQKVVIKSEGIESLVFERHVVCIRQCEITFKKR